MEVAELEFARMGMADLADLVALERLCFSAPWGEKEFRLGLEGKVFKVFGLREPSGLAAYISFYHVGEEMEVLNIAVRPELRQQGLGARLLGLVLQICRNMGIQSAHLEVRVSNDPARRLYSRFGFVHSGVRKGYYPDNGEDALCMGLDLTGKSAPSLDNS